MSAPLRGNALSRTTDETSIVNSVSAIQYYLAQTPRQLPSRYLYDELGSALFEAICRLPWYRIARAESRLLAAHGAEILESIASLSTMVELGSGSGDKLRLLLDVAGPRQSPLDVHLVDVSPSALDVAARAVGSLDHVAVIPHQAPYETGLAEALGHDADRGRTLVLFLGSNIGNFDPPGTAALLDSIRMPLAPGDALLLGADLVKPERDLVAAYDDPLGVTAAFNRNLLVRINRELDGDFNLDRFRHRAVWNSVESRVEMHLVSQSAQWITIRRADIEFHMQQGEPIWTESSYKYTPDRIEEILSAAGFRVAFQWIDPRDLFALTLAEAV
jgi:L-histidine Nalpha-methyltransferase